MYTQKDRCHDAVRYALKTGQIKNPKKCNRCGTTNRRILSHHADYSPGHELDIEWICYVCHQNIPETARKVSKANKGRAPWIKGKHQSKKYCQELSKRMMGKKYYLGKRHTDEWKRRASIANTGENNSYCKLTVDDVWTIRFVEIGSLQNIAKKYGVSKSNVSLIKLGKSWKSVILMPGQV